MDDPAAMSVHARRSAVHASVATALTALTDGQLRQLVSASQVVGSGIGGHARRLTVADAPVFVKQVPVNARESRADLRRATGNPYGLPAFCHYGVGSPGLNVWRELAVHERANAWVLTDTCAGFPLLHHWRFLAEAPTVGPPARDRVAREDIDGLVAFWHGSAAVRARLEANADATGCLLLFLEYVPDTLHDWLTARADADPDGADAAFTGLGGDLLDAVAHMNRAGVWHFDSHLQNVLTDGARIHLADFGLALASDFDLTDAEVAFLARNRAHDVAYTVAQLVNWAVRTYTGVRSPADRNAIVRRAAAGDAPGVLPPATRRFVQRHAEVATVVNDFYWILHGEHRDLPFPRDVVEAALGRVGLPVAPV
ncbi:hypothetical protein [Egicoccus sp. AB-alg2]|uniref:hypothetical protein n=1 Tax=Egicoccus sp. AB-alg2 TaxID=3242693 RepID=UPI00359E1538